MNEETTQQRAKDQGVFRPLKLTLTGFKGIRSGPGRETLTLDLESLVGESTV